MRYENASEVRILPLSASPSVLSPLSSVICPQVARPLSSNQVCRIVGLLAEGGVCEAKSVDGRCRIMIFYVSGTTSAANGNLRGDGWA